MRPIRLGLVGAANQGREHLMAARGCRLATIVAACDSSEAVRAENALAFPDLRQFAELADMLESQPLDGLVLALPHDAYEPLWTTLLATKLPMLKEKPLGRTLAEGAQFVARARSAAVPLVTAVQRRHHPTYVELKRRLEGEVVRELSATLHLGFDPSRRPHGWRGEPERAGGGALLDAGYHLVDLAIFLLGSVEVVHTNLWDGDRPATAETLESEACLVGRSGHAWLHLECCVGGAPDPTRAGKRLKHELVVVALESGQRLEASRSHVAVDGVTVLTTSREWTLSAAQQLDAFAQRILDGQFDDTDVWSQVPAMRVIDRAYAMARAVGPTSAGGPP